MRQYTIKRFWAKVSVKGPDDCWPWTAATNRTGYGNFWNNGMVLSHRFSYFLAHGVMPNVCRHICDNPPCVNPKHLLDGTQGDNVRDSVTKQSQRTWCNVYRMSTAATIVNHARSHLMSGTVEERDKLATTVNSSITSIVLTYMPSGFREGTVFEIGSELMYVWVATTGTKTLTVERGYDGTTAAAHTAGDIVTLNPRFPRSRLLTAINSELDDLSSGGQIFAEVEVALTYNGTDKLINLTSATNVIDLLAVKYRTSATDWTTLRYCYLQRGLPSTDFASTYAITFDRTPPAGTLRAVYAKSFTHVTTEADDMQTVALLPATCEDIVEYGAALCLMAGREVKRTFPESQGETRRADEVPPGATNQSSAALRAYRRDRIQAEATRLAKRYPKYNRR